MRVIKNFKQFWRNEWLWLIPAVAAVLVCYYRFPELHNDDHPEIIRYIAETGRRPAVEQFRSAQHMLYYHTAAAVLYRFLDRSEPVLGIAPDRAGQLLNLACWLGLTALLVPILRLLVKDFWARVFSLLVFGASTRWMTMAVTIDNDTMMAFFATLALLLTIRMIRRSEMPSWCSILLIAFIIGIAGAIKHNGQQFIIPFIGCLLSRRWLYRERMKALLGRTAVSLLIVLTITAPFYLRHRRDTGQWIYHDQGFHQDNWSGDRWEFFTFRFGEILRRPYIPYRDVTDVRLCPADLSWPSKIYMNWWSLPDFLPDRPPPGPTAAIFLSGLPLTFLFLIGLVLAAQSFRKEPGWLVPLGWFGVVIFFMAAASVLFPEPRWGCHTYPRHVLGAVGGIIPLFGLAFERVAARWPRAKFLLYLILAVHLLIFWNLLLSGPFYSLQTPWPKYPM